MGIGGLISGVIAGIIGAAVWGAIAFFGEVEIGWIAWAIGGAVGFAVSLGTKGGGVVPAIVAVLITIASLVGGKYFAVQLMLGKFDTEAVAMQTEMTDDDLVASLAYEIAEERTEAGETLAWPRLKSLTNVEDIGDYPKDVVDAAKEKLASMSVDDKNAMSERMNQQIQDMLGDIKQQLGNQAFKESFSGFDILFFLLGIATAGRIAFADYVE